MHHRLPGLWAKCVVEESSVVLCQIVSDKGLSTILVHSLQYLSSNEHVCHRWESYTTNLVACSITQTWKQGKELLANWRTGLILEDY